MQTPHRQAAGGFGPKTLLAKISTLIRNSYNLSRTPGAPETSTDPPEVLPKNLFQTLFSLRPASRLLILVGISHANSGGLWHIRKTVFSQS